MALHAIRRDTILGKFAFVEVGVASIARVENHRFGKAVRVALLAIHIHVFPLQWKIRQRMIEGVHVLQFLEAGLLVALRTIRPEFPFVRILVTGHALVLGHAFVIREHAKGITRLRMARKTIRGLVLSVQFERGRVVIETSFPLEIREPILAMALSTCTAYP